MPWPESGGIPSAVDLVAGPLGRSELQPAADIGQCPSQRTEAQGGWLSTTALYQNADTLNPSTEDNLYYLYLMFSITNIIYKLSSSVLKVNATVRLILIFA